VSAKFAFEGGYAGHELEARHCRSLQSARGAMPPAINPVTASPPQRHAPVQSPSRSASD
jgi:hypothetical protein